MHCLMAMAMFFSMAGPDEEAVAPSDLDGLLKLIRTPDRWSKYIDELPWTPTLWEARKKAAAEGKPLFLYWGNGLDPLGQDTHKGLVFRGSFFSRAEDNLLLKKHCVLAAFRGKDEYLYPEEWKFFSSLDPGDTHRLYYDFAAIVTPGGKIVDFVRTYEGNVGQDGKPTLAETLTKWKLLPESERKPSLTLPELGPKRPSHVPSPGTAILKQITLLLQRDDQGNLSLLKELPGLPDPVKILGDIGRNSLWITEEEMKSMVPENPRKGSRIEFPRSFVERLLRFHLADPCRAGHFWTRGQIRSAKLALHVGEVTSAEIHMKIQGSAAIATDEGRASSLHKGYQGEFLGRATYDRVRKAFSLFDLVAVGENGWDGSDKAVGATNWPRGPITTGRSFHLVPPDSIFSKVPPALRDAQAEYSIADYLGTGQ